jgi:hypothetical protein
VAILPAGPTLKSYLVWNQTTWWGRPDLDIHDLGDFPRFDKETAVNDRASIQPGRVIGVMERDTHMPWPARTMNEVSSELSWRYNMMTN